MILDMKISGLRKTILKSREGINGLEATTVFIFEELKNANNTLHR